MTFDFIPDNIKFALNFFHPALMWVLFAFSIHAGYQGWQWRRTRTAEGDLKKELVKRRYNQKHYLSGSIVLAIMVLGTVGGMAVTYINNGKLFFGPHLLAGLSMSALIAASAALSPLMQKGTEWARYTHITLNAVIVGLFGWQAITGTQIVQRILDN